MNRSRLSILFVVACVLFSFGMSAHLSAVVFERLPHLEDELAYLYQARILARGQLVVETPEPRLAFWQPFVIDRDGNRFGKYPLGFPALLALGEIAGAGWMVNALLGALSIALIYRLGCEMFSRRVGLIAALLLAFSPMALLLNATLMGHTAALMFTLLFMWAYGRGVQTGDEAGGREARDDEVMRKDGKNAVPTGSFVGTPQNGASLGWAILGGVSLGMVVANRPLAAVGIALPYAAWSVARLWAARGRWRAFWATLRPLLVIGVITLLFAATIPLFAAAATGDARTNLYTLVWSYDRIGFGECCGRSGHTLEKAFNHLRYDLSLLAADLHGIQLGTFDADTIEHLLRRANNYPNLGLSFILPVLGALVLFWRVRGRLAIWLGVAAGWVALPFLQPDLFLSPLSAWVWVIGAGAWVLSALRPHYASRITHYSPLLLVLALMPFVVHMTYWIGSQRYSTRYYFEALGALVLLSAVGLAWVSSRVRLRWVMAGLVAACLLTLVTYSLPRISILHGFNGVSQAWIGEARRRGGEGNDLLVIVTGTELSWRAMGSFMAVTSPYLDSQIIAIYNRVSAAGEPGLREQVIAQFPDRVVIDLTATGADAAFAD
jgi:4-amino-4-deoxy-L-arabinose transferase-like glycosyltransferase